LACPHHGKRQTTGGFICIQCDPQAVAASGAATSQVQNRLHEALLAEAGHGRPLMAWVQPSVQEWASAFVDPFTEQLDPGIGRMLDHLEELRHDIDRQTEDVEAMAHRLEPLVERRTSVQALAEYEPVALSLAQQVRDIWQGATAEGQRLIALGVLQAGDVTSAILRPASAVFAAAFDMHR
jgi:hypothetical protein